jgi:hypothetical protein
MASLLLLAAALAADPAGSGSRLQDNAAIAHGPAVPAANPRGFHEYQSQLSDLLRREALARDPAAKAALVCALCELHGEIVRDSRYAASDKLKEYRARLWSRLTKIKTELKQQLARDAKTNKEALETAALLQSADPAAVAAADSLAATLALVEQTQGGPGALLGHGGRAIADNGRALVELIERTINPAFWDVAGGPGTIVYYAPLQCLVVRATSEVHGKIGGVLGDIRAAGP